MFPIVVFLEPFDCSCSDTLAMTDGTLIEVFSDFFTYLLRLEWYRVHDKSTVTTVICDISTFRVEVGFTLLPKRWYVHEIEIGSGHKKE
jgi:hypothetical protein